MITLSSFAENAEVEIKTSRKKAMKILVNVLLFDADILIISFVVIVLYTSHH